MTRATDHITLMELNKHYLVFDRPHIYACSCGYEIVMFVVDGKLDQRIFKKPKNKIKYLPCGHAACALKVIDNREECMICLNTGG